MFNEEENRTRAFVRHREETATVTGKVHNFSFINQCIKWLMVCPQKGTKIFCSWHSTKEKWDDFSFYRLKSDYFQSYTLDLGSGDRSCKFPSTSCTCLIAQNIFDASYSENPFIYRGAAALQCWHPHPIVKGEPRQPLEEAHFCLYPWSFSSHYSHLVAMGEWRNLHTRLPLRLNRPVHIHCALLIHLLSTTHKQDPEVLELLHSRQIRAVSAPFSCWQRCFCGTNSHPSHVTLSCQSPHLMLEVN